MFLERRLLSYIAMLIATLYYLFGRADAAILPRLPAAMLEEPALEQVLEVTR